MNKERQQNQLMSRVGRIQISSNSLLARLSCRSPKRDLQYSRCQQPSKPCWFRSQWRKIVPSPSQCQHPFTYRITPRMESDLELRPSLRKLTKAKRKELKWRKKVGSRRQFRSRVSQRWASPLTRISAFTTSLMYSPSLRSRPTFSLPSMPCIYQLQPEIVKGAIQISMIENLEKGSVLSLTGYELLSLSHRVKVADHEYYLLKLMQVLTKKTVYTWEEISIVRSKFPMTPSGFKKLVEQGCRLETMTKWPEWKAKALMQIRQKFLHQGPQEVKPDCPYEFEQELHGPRKQQKGELKKPNAAAVYLQKLNRGKSQQRQKKYEQEERRIERYSFASDQEEEVQHEEQRREKKDLEYLAIKQVKLDRKRRKVNFIIENIMGERKLVKGKQLKATHLYEVIAFLQKELGFTK